MKIVKYTLLCALFFSSFQSLAQLDRRISHGRSIQTNPSSTKPTFSDKEKKETIQKTVDRLNNVLKLDELQLYAVKNEIEKNVKSIEIVFSSEISDSEKMKQYNAIYENTETNILTYLNKEQKEKYKVLIEERKSKMTQ